MKLMSPIASRFVRAPITILRATSKRWRAFNWNRKHPNYLVVFNWHQVTPGFEPSRHHEFTWTQLDHFKAEIDYLQSTFKILPLHDAIIQLESASLKGRCASLSFDDGDTSIAEHVFQFLLQRRLPATFFINSAYLDGNDLCWVTILWYLCYDRHCRFRAGLTDELLTEALQLRSSTDPQFYNRVRGRVEQFASYVPNLKSRYVAPEWLHKLDGHQFAIGAHGHEHQRYSMMLPDWQRDDLCKNINFLKQYRAYRPLFAVPFGRAQDWTNDTACVAREFKLKLILADGGVNIIPGAPIRRIPSDAKALKRLLMTTMAEL